MAKKEITPESVWNEYETACNFKAGLNLYDNVRANENFYIGKQWEGVQSNGLPTPVFNFIKRIILYVVASTATDNLKMAASPLSSSGMAALGDLERLTDVVNAQFEALFEQNKLGKQTREFMRNAAVDGDACIYVWFDPDAETGQTAKGTIRTEILENTRVSFGNPTNRDVQSQPYLLISRRELLDEVKEQARAQGGAAEDILSDCDETGDRFDAMTDGKVTTITRFWKDGGTVRAIKTTKDAVVRSQWDTGMQLYGNQFSGSLLQEGSRGIQAGLSDRQRHRPRLLLLRHPHGAGVERGHRAPGGLPAHRFQPVRHPRGAG